jgi:hypothetical protein
VLAPTEACTISFAPSHAVAECHAVGHACNPHRPSVVQFNTLDDFLPEYNTVWESVIRNGVIGLSAATVAACTSNWMRVIKTTKQTHVSGKITYWEARSHISTTC